MTRRNAGAKRGAMNRTGSAIPVITSISQICRGRRAWLCDIWGVLHNGVENFPEALAACRTFRSLGGRIILISNSPRPSPGVIAQLEALGVGPDCYDGIVTSGDVTVELVRQRGRVPLFHLGPKRDESIFHGLDLNFVTPDEARLVVCTGLFEDETETAEDYRELLSCLAARNVPMICGNPDKWVEKGDRLIPCAGLLAEMYEAMGQQVTYAGKPYASIYELAVAKAGPVEKYEILAIGDGIHTDIAGAGAQGIEAVFVASGVHVGPAGSGPLTEEAVAALFSNSDYRPIAAIPRLAW